MLSLCAGAAFRFSGFHPVFSVVYSLFFSLALFLHTLAFVFSEFTASIAKRRGCAVRRSSWRTPGRSGATQRGRGRGAGRAVSGRGRMRKRGPSGGGTLRSASPQEGQRPSMPKGRVASARSQWPRASHCGLMHCTVKPGRNCICLPLSDRQALSPPVEWRGPSSLLTDEILARILA
jgi:hypothetical protein